MRGLYLLALSPLLAMAASPLDGSKQVIVVTSSGWDSVSAELSRYERPSGSSAWQRVGGSVPVVLGKRGMAWGVGLHPASAADGPVKKEGDGRSPAGMFHIGELFGLAPGAAGFHLPYHPEKDSTECVDDVKSSHYNQVVDRDRISAPDWDSSEKMKEVGEAYRWGAVVEHNPAPSHPGAGSCIFLHVATNKTGTVGCTAMGQDALVVVLRWLRAEDHPVLVQLPKPAYAAFRESWRLP